MYNNGNGGWDSRGFVPASPELCFYEEQQCFGPTSASQQFDGKRPRLATMSSCLEPQFLSRNEHCVNFNVPFAQLSPAQGPIAYTPPLAESPISHHVPTVFSGHATTQQFDCGRVIQQPPVARQVITAAPYYGMSGCQETIFAPCQNVQPWTYAYCYGYFNQQPCQFAEFVDIEDFMSNEKRKEKSRDAARCRRSRETEIFTELAQVLPLPKEDVDQLDKASVMRVAIAYLKIREMLQLFRKIKDISDEPLDNVETNESDDESSEVDKKESKLIDLWRSAETHKLLTQTLDGFLIILSNDGDVTYVSENITEYLGISKIDILGQQIWEYTHQCEHGELKEALNIRKNGLTEKVKDENLIEEGITTDHRDLFIRLKCTLTSRGRSVNIKSATYKVIHITGHLVVNTKGDRVLIAVGRPIPHPSNIEIPLGTTTFLTKHSLDMKFTYVDDKMTDLFGYKPEDLLDKSLFECHHGGDTDSLMATFKGVHTKGQGETCRYRFLGKCGGYCWIVTQATLVYDKQKPQSVVCVNYVISNLENNNEIYSLAQYEASQLEKIESNVNNISIASTQPQKQQQSIELTETKPKPIIPHSAVKQQILQDPKQKVHESVDLASDLLSPELSKKTCVDVDEKTSTAAVELKRENSKAINTNAIPTTQTAADQINKKHVPSVTSFRAIQHHQELFRRNQLSKSTLPSKFIEEKRPKSVTASVFRTTNEKPTVTGSVVGLQQSIGHNSILLNQSTNLPQLNVAPHAQSVTASVFTPISQRSTGNQQTSQPLKHLAQSANHQQQQQQQQQQQTSPVSRSVEMNKGYLSYVEDAAALTMLKEEPDDLTHLAPTGVDACLPLDEATPFFQEIMSGLLSYGSLLPDDINSLDSQNSANQTTGSTNNKGHIDPFINYREESNDTNCSQHLLSPSITSKSPEASSLPSLCSPNSLSQEDDFPFMTMNVDDEMTLTMRAPYIPMNEQDDLPLLTDDLIWGVSFNSDELGIQKDDPMQYNTLKQVNLSTNNRMLNSNNGGSCITPDLTISSPSASPMSISSSSAASSPSPCSSHSSLSMHNQQGRSFGGAMLCNSSGGGGGGGDNSSGGGGGDGSAGGGNSSLNVDDSDSGISSINSMSPQHTHHHHSSHNQHQQQQQQQQHHQHHHHHHQPQQQHQHQQQHSPMSIGSDGLGLMTCKKEIDSANLCDSIDAFESVYTKDSSNLDCWTVPEFLNINSDDSSVAVDDMQQTHKQQNLIINTTTLPTNTMHVPLITIQNNKNLSMSQQRTNTSSPLSAGTIQAGTIHNTSSASSSPSLSSSAASAAATVATSSITASAPQQSTGTTSLSSATSNCHNNSNSNKQCGGGSLILSEEIIQNSRKLTGKLPTNNTAATIRISNGNLSTGRLQQSPPKATILQTTNFTTLQGNNNHKRHLTTTGASSLDSKRLKNSSTVEIQTSPHLLQQLMAPAPQKQRVVVKTAGAYDKSQAASRWTKENGGGKGDLQQQQLLRNQQQDSNMNQHNNQSMSSMSSSSSAASSNSVLKNLLISGCDGIHVKTGPEIMITDDISNDSIAQLSPCDSFTSMSSETSTAKVMRNYRSNPMIGGPGVIPSPTFSEDSNPPGLLTMGDTDSSSDSGIDESCIPNKRLLKEDGSTKFYEKLSALSEAVKTGDVLISNTDQCANSATIQILGRANTATAAPLPTAAAAAHKLHATTARNNRRKPSVSYIDPEYPLMTTLLMELCNDDYNMNESNYLEHTDLVQVLNELNNDIDLSDDSS